MFPDFMKEYHRPAGLPSLRERIRMALAEDLDIAGDITTRAVFEPEQTGKATIVAKADGVICGLPVADMVFDEVGQCEVKHEVSDGDRITSGQIVATIHGPVISLLAGERVALNFLQRLSGIATLTRRYVDAVEGKIKIYDTRKTTPLWRDLEKYAVRCGGGENNRKGLYDMVMLKDTHADGAHGLIHALTAVRPIRGEDDIKVAAEARTLAEVEMALTEGVDLIMLDNMPPQSLAAAIRMIGGRVETEVTGGITVEAAVEVAKLGVDRVSVGAITHSASVLDLSMRLSDYGTKR